MAYNDNLSPMAQRPWVPILFWLSHMILDSFYSQGINNHWIEAEVVSSKDTRYRYSPRKE